MASLPAAAAAVKFVESWEFSIFYNPVISEYGTITMKMISSARNNGREQTKIGSINIRVVPPAPQRSASVHH